MPTYTSTTKEKIKVATKAEFANVIKGTFTETRRLRCFRDANASATDPVSTGTEFLNAGLSGDMVVVGGDIVSFGILTNITIRQAADLTTGTSVLIIEDNGERVQFTLGLDGSNKEYTLAANPTGSPNQGFAFSSSKAGLKAPASLNSGTGWLAPSSTTDLITSFNLCDHSSGSRVLIGNSPFSYQEGSTVVMDHPAMAREYGDVRIMRTPDGGGLVMGTGGDCFRFAGMTYIMSPKTNGEENKPMQQVVIRAVPHNRWASYPFKKDLNLATDTLIPGAHKIELLRADGTIVDIIEAYSTRDTNNTPGSGKPVNDPSFAQTYTSGKRLQPYWTCQMEHLWWSNRPKAHSLARHFVPPVEDEALHPSNVRQQFSDTLCWPVITGADTWNSLGAYRISPKWGRVRGDQSFDTTIEDPYSIGLKTDGYVSQTIGYGFEPGANGKHTWYMAPGGTRHDRHKWAHVVAVWSSKPDMLRPHGNVPYTELMYHWIANYANYSQHYFTNLEKGLGIPKSKVLNGEICFNDVYYLGSTENYRPDIDNNAVRLLSATNKQNSGNVDKNGKRFTNEFSRDYMHTHSNAAVGAYTHVSFHHVMMARHSFTAHVLAAFDLTQSFNRNMFLAREHGWHMSQFADMWLMGNNAPDSFTQVEIEDMWGKHLEMVYDTVYPSYSTGTDAYSVCLRRLGMGMKVYEDTNTRTARIEPVTDSKAFYLSAVFLFMKQTGSWEKMRARSAKCAAALDMMMDCLCKFAIGMFVDANGRGDKAQGTGAGDDGYCYPAKFFTYNMDNPVFPNHWGEVYPPKGKTDWLREESGVLTSDISDRTNTMHMRAQFLRMVKDFFPEYKPARLDLAISIMNKFYAEVAAAYTSSNIQFNYRFAMFGLHKKPQRVGPPA